MDECIHGLGPVACCVVCNGRAAREDRVAKLEKEMAGPYPYWLFRKDAGRKGARWSGNRPIEDRLLVRGGLIDEFGASKARVR